MNILIAGGTGLVGQKLQQALESNSHTIKILTRNPAGNANAYAWDVPNQTIDPKSFEGVDCIINLTGENIATKRWTKAQKKKIYQSRVHSTNLLFEKAKEHCLGLKTFITASAIGFYDSLDLTQEYSEGHIASTDFLGHTCKKWEEASKQFQSLGVRVVQMRIGVVLSREGGLLAKVLPLANKRLNAVLGDGKQYIPWIHIEDLAQMFVKAVEDPSMKNAYNAVASQHTTNKEFTLALNKLVGKTCLVPPAPRFMIKLLFGEMSEIMLNGTKISNKKIKSTGFVGKYDNLELALSNLVLET